jgi:branched-chain amino acid transport system permease protein
VAAAVTAGLRSGPLGGAGSRVLEVWRHKVYGSALKLTLVFVILPVVSNAFGPWKRVPFGTFVAGAVVGALYGLLAVGLVLVYKANRIISFAQASLGSVPAVLALYLMSSRGVPWVLVVPVVLVLSPLLGGAVELLLRRFSGAPRLILTVATIGVGLVLAFVEFNTPRWVGGTDTGLATFPTPFTKFTFSIGTQVLTGDHLLAVGVTVVLVCLVAAFFRYTDIGLATRASAENAERASLLGIPVRRVSLIVWMLAALLSGVALFLRGPLLGVAPGGSAGPSVLIYGLAAAVIARMESPPVAFFSGTALGMVVQGTTYVTDRSSTADGALLLVILGALLVQKNRLGRADDTGVATWQAAKEFKAIPSELRALKEVVLAKQVTWAVVGVFALAAPWILPGDAGRLAIVCCDAMVCVSLVLLTGWAGQISLGQFGFAGVGGLVTAKLAADRGWDFPTVLLVAGCTGALVAVLIGIPALRIKGLFLAVATLAFAFTVQLIVLNPDYTGDGSSLIKDQLVGVPRPLLYGRFDIAPERRFYYVCLFFLSASLAAAAGVRKHRSGRILMATRDNPRVAQAFGVNLARTKLAAFAISGFIAAVAGSLFSFELGVVDAQAFTPLISIAALAAVVIGGTTSLPGAVLGSIWVFGIPLLLERRFPGIGFLASGVGLLVLLLAVPGGLAELLYMGRDGFLRWVADRHQLIVPSLVADKRQEMAKSHEADDEILELAAEHAVEVHFDDVAVASGPAITSLWCPVCLGDVPGDEVVDHPHFRPPPPSDEVVEHAAFAPEAPVGATNGSAPRVARTATRRQRTV